jgi:RNA polymerase sigma-70 factor (ECF subfamily)
MMERALTPSMRIVADNQDADTLLVDQYLAGNTAAFDEIMIRYERQIYRVCYRFVDNREDAMDLAQEVFIKAFEHLPTFRRESTLKTWLYRIAMNHCINHVKKNRQEFVEISEYTGSVGASAQSGLEDSEQREHFRRLVKQLPPKQKAILELRINEQLSYDEIAKISGRSISTIKASVFFALEKLRKLVKDPNLKKARG